MDRLRRRLSNESGQAAVLIALLCGVMIVIVAATTNLGKVVTEKIAMQNAVDLAVYSGAATQAGHLNQMRKYNQDIYKVLYGARRRMQSDFILNPLFLSAENSGAACSAKAAMPNGMRSMIQEGLLLTDEAQIRFAEIQIKKHNLIGARNADTAASDAADLNYRGTGGHLVPLQGRQSRMMQIENKQVHISYHSWCMQAATPPYPVRSTYVYNHKLPGWYYKNDRGQVMYAAKIRGAAPSSGFLEIAQNYFTPKGGDCVFGSLVNGRCTLETFAVAEPYHGKLGSILNGQGGATWEKNWSTELNNQKPAQTSDDKKSALDDHKVIGNHYEDYKVRFVGIFEQDMKVIGRGTSVTTAARPYGHLMEH